VFVLKSQICFLVSRKNTQRFNCGFHNLTTYRLPPTLSLVIPVELVIAILHAVCHLKFRNLDLADPSLILIIITIDNRHYVVSIIYDITNSYKNRSIIRKAPNIVVPWLLKIDE